MRGWTRVGQSRHHDSHTTVQSRLPCHHSTRSFKRTGDALTQHQKRSDVNTFSIHPGKCRGKLSTARLNIMLSVRQHSDFLYLYSGNTRYPFPEPKLGGSERRASSETVLPSTQLYLGISGGEKGGRDDDEPRC